MSEAAFLWAVRSVMSDEELDAVWHHLRRDCADLDHGMMPDHLRASARWHAEPASPHRLWSDPYFLVKERALWEVKLGMVHAEIKARLGLEERRMGPYLGGAGRDEWSDVGWRWEYWVCMRLSDEEPLGHRPVPPDWLDEHDCCIDLDRCQRLRERYRDRLREYEEHLEGTPVTPSP